MGHDGFPTGLKEVWELLPEPQTIEVRLWHQPAAEVPDGREEQIDWLFELVADARRLGGRAPEPAVGR